MIVHIQIENVHGHKDVFVINQIAFEQDTEVKLVNRLRKSKAFIPELSLTAKINSDIRSFISISGTVENSDEFNLL